MQRSLRNQSAKAKTLRLGQQGTRARQVRFESFLVGVRRRGFVHRRCAFDLPSGRAPTRLGDAAGDNKHHRKGLRCLR
jgi:hypothetical protein